MRALASFVLALLGLACEGWGQEVVRTNYGEVQGFKEVYGSGHYVLHFLGIPYALPPVGDRRFRKPQPPSSWNGVRNATMWSDGCMQIPYSQDKRFSFSEDCLYLNVYVPQGTARGGLPVMVWVHGGAYEKGTGVTRQGNVLARKGVVVVSFNYRLGPFGFLTTMDAEAPGNYGMLDQVMALTWVRDNIAAFGGDPTKVTVFGESAGGSSVSLLMLSPLSRGLFRAAIMESGVSLSDHAVAFTYDDPSPSQHARDLGAALGCAQADSSSLVACLRQKPARSLLDHKVPASPVRLTWSPVVDGFFLPDSPRRLLEQDKIAKVPVIRGCNSDESSIFGMVVGIPNIDQGLPFSTFRQLVSNFTAVRYPGNRHRSQMEAEIIKVYTGHINTADPAAVRQAYIQLWTDHNFCAPTVLVNQVTTRRYNQPPVFFYVFDHQSRFAPWPRWKGVPHASELLYVFGIPFMGNSSGPVTAFNQRWSQEDRDVSELIMTLWSNFAKTRNPTPQAVGGVTWSPFTSYYQAYLHIRHDTQVTTNFRFQESKLWNVDIARLAQQNHQNGHVVG